MANLTRQARLEAEVKYGPEEDELRDALADARRALASRKALEEGAARAIIGVIDKARPEIRRAYQRSQADAEAARSEMSADLAKLSSAADVYKGAAAREWAGARRRMSEALAFAERELSERKIETQSGALWGKRQAESDYAAESEKIHGKLRKVARLKGAFTQSQLYKLKKDEREYILKRRRLALTKRGQDLAERRALRNYRLGKARLSETRRYHNVQSRAKRRDQSLARAKFRHTRSKDRASASRDNERIAIARHNAYKKTGGSRSKKKGMSAADRRKYDKAKIAGRKLNRGGHSRNYKMNVLISKYGVSKRHASKALRTRGRRGLSSLYGKRG